MSTHEAMEPVNSGGGVAMDDGYDIVDYDEVGELKRCIDELGFQPNEYSDDVNDDGTFSNAPVEL